jgi:ketosteroid isomerase-like protein
MTCSAHSRWAAMSLRGSGQRFAVPFAHVIRVNEGRVTELRGHVDTATITSAFTATTIAS